MMREYFETAKSKDACIIFSDEAIGRAKFENGAGDRDGRACK